MGENGKYKPVKEKSKVFCSSNQCRLIWRCSLICNFFWVFVTLREYGMTNSKASEELLYSKQIVAYKLCHKIMPASWHVNMLTTKYNI
jgi:hypothetical protein